MFRTHPWPQGLSAEQAVPVILQMAGRVGRSLPASLAQGLDEEAVAHVAARIHTYVPCADPTANAHNFQAWCCRVLRNLGNDLIRSAKRARRHLRALAESLPGEFQAWAPPEPPALPANLLRLQVALRQPWPVRSSGGVDLRAVFLVYLRLALLARVVAELRPQRPLPEGGVPTFVARCLPWTDTEGRRCFRPGWPTIEQLWDGLSAEIEERPKRVTCSVLTRVVTALSQGQLSLTPGRWGTWCARARDEAQERLGPVAWEACLDWLPGLRDQVAPEEQEEHLALRT